MSTNLNLQSTVAIAKTSPPSTSTNVKRSQVAATVYDFRVQISSGCLEGSTFEGVLSYDSSTLSGKGFETIGIAEGLKISFTFFSNKYSESDDVRFPDSPAVQFKDGELSGLKYAPFDFIFYLSSQSQANGESSFTYDLPTGSGEGSVAYFRRTASVESTYARTGFGLSGLNWLLRRKAIFPQKA
jgi:hypothetical protein